MAYKGRFIPINKDKYVGNVDNIIYRSLWELQFLKFLDNDSNVLAYTSEELVIKYISPIDNREHRYFVDFLVKTKLPNGDVKVTAVEIKPDIQTRPPDASKNKTKTGRVSRRYLKEVKTFAINTAKWNAARKYCEKKGWEFKIATEYDLGIRGVKKRKQQ